MTEQKNPRAHLFERLSLKSGGGDVETRLSRVEEELGPAPLQSRQLAMYALGVMGIVIISSAIIYTFGYRKDYAFLMEFLSYAFAAFAAVVVGMGLFFRNERRWFWFSMLAVFVGQMAFIASKGPVGDIAYLVIALNGILGAVILLPVYKSRVEAAGEKLSKKVVRINIFLTAGSLFFAGVVIAFVSSTVHPASVKQWKCNEVGKDDKGRLRMLCDPPSDGQGGSD